MIHGKHISRHRPDSLALLSLFVALAAVVTTAVGGNAGGPAAVLLDDTRGGDVRMLHLDRGTHGGRPG